MKPIGRLSTTSTGLAGFGTATLGNGAIIFVGTGTVRAGAGRVNVLRGGIGGRLNGLTAGCSAICPSYFGPTYGLQVESSSTMAHI